jgi:hypothetical protein
MTKTVVDTDSFDCDHPRCVLLVVGTDKDRIGIHVHGDRESLVLLMRKAIRAMREELRRRRIW